VPPATSLDAVEVADRLRPVLLQLNRRLRREAHSQGVTPGQLGLLATINGTPGIGVGELAAREGMTAPAVCAHADKLEAAGLVARTRQGDGGDRRRVGLTVTSEGVRVLRAVRTRRTAWLASRLRELDERQLDAVDAAIEPLRRLIEPGS
jgi:DNA-binding MarR family transcriptional regulator